MPSIESWIAPFFYIVDPGKRLFFVYLGSALLLAVLTLWLGRKQSLVSVVESLFNPKIWFHSSSQIDFQLMFLNSFLKTLLFLVVSLSSVQVAKKVAFFLATTWPVSGPSSLSSQSLWLLYGVISFLTSDFSRFFQHYLFHKVAFLWRFHKIHHSARVMTPITLFRTHPVESVVASFRRIFVIGIVSGVFIYYSQSLIGGMAILGVNAFDFIFNLLGSNLRHSHVALSFGPLNYLFVSPVQHQLHHSRAFKHRDKNLGIALSCWDQIFGTFENAKSQQKFIFGVHGENYKNLWQALVAPLNK